MALDGFDASDGFDGSILRGALDSIREWLGRFVCVTDLADLDLMAVWAAHTHVAVEVYSTPRLILDSTMPGSGKTTVLEHLHRLCYKPIQAASLSSPALLARMLDQDVRTILIDEADRTLDPKKPGVEELIAVLNSGYKRGGTRPVLVPGRGGTWDVAEMPTYAPVVMAGNSPALPDDTRSRSIRVLLMPDYYGRAESSDWEEIEPDALDLAESLKRGIDAARDTIRAARPTLPGKCIGRMKEKWNPLARVAAAAGGRWPTAVTALIERDLEEAELEREEGLMKRSPQVVLLEDLHHVWPEGEMFRTASDLVAAVTEHNPDYWGDGSAYGRPLTVQRFGRILAQIKVHRRKDKEGVYSSKDGQDRRGYQRQSLIAAWRAHGLIDGSNGTPEKEPSKPSEPPEPSNPEADAPASPEHGYTGYTVTPAPTPPEPDAWDDPGYCQHGVTIGARCRYCAKQSAALEEALS